MIWRTRNLLLRLFISLSVSILGIAAVTICFLSGAGLPGYIVGAFLLILNLIVWGFFFIRPFLIQREKDREFAGKGDIQDGYEEVYYWTKDSHEVIKRFRLMTDRQKAMELAIESSRVIAMRDQINPHFLYNTLDAIRSDMLISGNEQTAETVEALSNYFAYVASGKDEITTVYEELENVRDYFQIQKYRFGDRMEMEIVDEIGDEEQREILMPRLVLQPLVENAISHGLESSYKAGLITLILRQTGKNLEIHVTDNGVGMSEEELNRLNDRLRNPVKEQEQTRRKKGGIAMNNVNSRIRLLYGEDYGIRVFSMQGIGTDVTVTLPCRRKEQPS